MIMAASWSRELRDFYAEEFARIREQFLASGDGNQALRARTELVDKLLCRVWQECMSSQPQGPRDVALVALGGYGRGWLFPYSDIDLLLLHAGEETQKQFAEASRQFCQEIWDIGLKVSNATRSLAECERFIRDNVEFTISLLDCRYVCGDPSVFSRLREKVIPRLVMREAQSLVQSLAEVNRARHAKHGNTIFHLEPNIKESPGGVRDYNISCWLSLISAMDKLRDWPDAASLLPVSNRKSLAEALEFLIAVRCFLHYRHGRDDNTLSWEAQDEAAVKRIGTPDAEVKSAADWMRIYFGHVRSIDRLATQLEEEIPAAWSSVYRQFQQWRSRISNADFSVVDGLIFLSQPSSLQNPEMLLRLFHFVAHHGLRLSRTTEARVEQVLPSLATMPPRGAELWLYLQETLVQPFAADALRSMHSLRLLTLLLPELRGIDALVVRDYYHRFTVDEHSFLAIEHLHRLKGSQLEWDRRYAQLLEELEEPELLYLALLLHDAGKGEFTPNHVLASLDLAESCMDRLDLEPSERETVHFLIANHLEISAALRRDIFDPKTVAAFAEKVGTSERLKMLCLLTYADIKAVNTEALTPWKAENVWQLYIATANHLTRSVDQRLHPDANDGNLHHLRSLASMTGKNVKVLLEGMPERYPRVHAAEEVLTHAEMAAKVGSDPVQLELKRGRHWYELTVVTTDRPLLFASIAGALAAWGMNIVKANAFSNSAGTVVDTVYFTDRFRTLELNLPEWERFKTSVAAVLNKEADLARMLRERFRSETSVTEKVKVVTSLEFDDNASAQSTMLQVVTQDRPGLLYRISSLLGRNGYNIEIALIDTEGQMAIDAFYLTSGGGKLAREEQKQLRGILMDELGSG
jgi:[protein-PII] uridylyltransferase